VEKKHGMVLAEGEGIALPAHDVFSPILPFCSRPPDLREVGGVESARRLGQAASGLMSAGY
jgi:hypothetical protein